MLTAACGLEGPQGVEMKVFWSRLSPLAIAVSLVVLGVIATPAHADYSTSARSTWSPNNTVYSITTQGDRTYVGGKFINVKEVATGTTVNRNRIAAFDSITGDLITSFHPTINGDVRAIDVSPDGSTIYVAGAFTTVNGVSKLRVAALNRDGDLISGWTADAASTVKDLVVVGDSVYLGGTFGKVNGVSRPGLAKVAASNGALDKSWKVVVGGGGKPRAIAASPNGTDLVVAGAFGTLAGAARQYLGSVNLVTGVATDWAPVTVCSACDLFDVTAAGDRVYAAVGGGGGYAASWSATSNTRVWSVKADGNVQAVDYLDGTLYVGGHFGPTFAGNPRNQLAAVNATNGLVLPFAPNLGTSYFPGVWAIEASPEFLRIGGGFRTVAGVAQAKYAELPFG